MTSLAERIASAMASAEPAVERSVFGQVAADEIAASFDAWCTEHLDSRIGDCWLWAVSVGCVAGLVLDDGRHVVVKAHPPHRSPARLAVVAAVQERARAAGLPAPQPLAGPQPLGLGWATADEALIAGRHPDLLRSPDRDTAAAGWTRLIAALSPSAAALADVERDPNRVVDGLYPLPHSPVFDFEATSAGAEWIDELAISARDRTQRLDAPPVVVHADWRGENLRVSADGSELVAIYDWDSVRVGAEVVALGEVAAMHSIDWATPGGPYFATAAECVAFAAAVERTRPTPFTPGEWHALRAAIVFGWCYTARCEHAWLAVGDDKPQFGMRARLRRDGAALLAMA